MEKIREVQTFKPVDMDMAGQLERTAAMYADCADLDLSRGWVWRPYTDANEELQHYPITPQVVMLMRHVRNERFNTLPSRETAESLVEKYLRPGESIRERNRMPL